MQTLSSKRSKRTKKCLGTKHPGIFCVREARANRKGFSLLELVLVLALVGTLAALSLPVLGQAGAQRQAAQVRTLFTEIELALEAYKSAYGIYPSALTSATESAVNLSSTENAAALEQSLHTLHTAHNPRGIQFITASALSRLGAALESADVFLALDTNLDGRLPATTGPNSASSGGTNENPITTPTALWTQRDGVLITSW